jgi:uncharacterized pyridoxamine 5'-phosphate oxidase family protein
MTSAFSILALVNGKGQIISKPIVLLWPIEKNTAFVILYWKSVFKKRQNVAKCMLKTQIEGRIFSQKLWQPKAR